MNRKLAYTQKSNISQRVIVDVGISNWKSVLSGVQQFLNINNYRKIQFCLVFRGVSLSQKIEDFS